MYSIKHESFVVLKKLLHRITKGVTKKYKNKSVGD